MRRTPNISRIIFQRDRYLKMGKHQTQIDRPEASDRCRQRSCLNRLRKFRESGGTPSGSGSSKNILVRWESCVKEKVATARIKISLRAISRTVASGQIRWSSAMNFFCIFVITVALDCLLVGLFLFSQMLQHSFTNFLNLLKVFSL